MGFKRTSEGRVYFQRSGTTANDEHGTEQRQVKKSTSPFQIRDKEQGQQEPINLSNPINPPKPNMSAPMQTEIIALLKSLNDRLKTTQAERNHMRQQMSLFRELIEDLDEKTTRTEKAYTKLEGKVTSDTEGLAKETLKELEETRKLLLSLEEKQAQYDETLEQNNDDFENMVERLQKAETRQEELGHQVDEAITQQSRLIRKIDKATEDRARFMRKIERIEEAVLQTRDSLNAKAMVLLTDQGVAGQEVPAPNKLDDLYEDGTSATEKALAEKVIEQVRAAPRPKRVQRFSTEKILAQLVSVKAAWALVFALFLAFLTWGILNWSAHTDSETRASSDFMPPQVSDLLRPEADIETSMPEETPDIDTSVLSESPVFEPEDVPDDIGTVNLNNDEAVLNLLEEDPEALAARLNNLEPGTVPNGEAGESNVEIEEEVVTAHEAPVDISQPVAGKDRLLTADEGNIAAQQNPGLPEMIQKVEQEAMRGSPEAQHDLAAIYTAGHSGVKQDYERAVYWFKKAAEAGIPNASYNLGVLYHQGLGVKPDIKEAIAWYTKAAAQGHPEAQYNLGIAHIEGIGVTYNPEKSATYFRNAAENGVVEAAYNLGLIYENGLLGEAKPDEAIMWYKTAADQGNPEARAALEQLAKTLGIDLDDVNRLADTMKQSQVSKPTLQEPVAEVDAPPQKVVAATAVSQDSGAEVSKINDPAPVVNVIEPTSGSSAETYMDTQVLLSQVQTYLMEAGLFPGPADGLDGPLTRDAIRSYQSAHGLSVTGVADKSLLQYMEQQL